MKLANILRRDNLPLNKQHLFLFAAFIGGFLTCLLFTTINWTNSTNFSGLSASVAPNTNLRKSHHQKVKTKVVIFIPTPIDAVLRRYYVYRQFLREKWDPSIVQLFFVVGTKTGKYLEQDLNMTSIYEEQQATGARFLLSQCRDFGDEENNGNGTSSTTCKVYEGVKYAYEHYDAEYCFRGADDSFINIHAFLEVTSTMNPHRAPWIMGQLRVPVNPHQNFDLLLNRQPELMKIYGQYIFGQYMLGCGYVFTWDVARFIATWTIPPHDTNPEDVIVGMWLNPFRIEKISDHYQFDYLNIMRKYNVPNRTITLIHYVNTASDWDSIDENGTFHLLDGLYGHFPVMRLDFSVTKKLHYYKQKLQLVENPAVAVVIVAKNITTANITKTS
jgi:hypothetical protein